MLRIVYILVAIGYSVVANGTLVEQGQCEAGKFCADAWYIGAVWPVYVGARLARADAQGFDL